MQNTGRIQQTIGRTAQRVLIDQHESGGWPHVCQFLRFSSKVDLAHIVMLAEQNIVPREVARRLAVTIIDLQEKDFEPLRGGNVARGFYLLYEDYLVQQLGADVAGRLHTGRSRNDLHATVFRLQVRNPYFELTRELVRLIAVILVRARRYIHFAMPMYTHGQPAMPSTYGHYLTGVATALIRDLEGIRVASCDLCESPLGASAGAGTTWPINTGRTALLLGFNRVATHSLDAVASRDLSLRLLAATAINATTLSRLAFDLRQWTTLEFGFFDLPDSVVGSSSAMPQKRNPYFLEHVHGKAGLVVGAFQGAATAVCGTPFANCIAVGTESIKPLWTALDELKRSAVLLRLFIHAARPRSDRMLRSAVAGYTTATLIADNLVRQGGIDFRSAHAIVGRLISDAQAEGDGEFMKVSQRHLAPYGTHVDLIEADPRRALDALRYGNGPAPDCVSTMLADLRARWAELYRSAIVQRENWKTAEKRLDDCVAVISGLPGETKERFNRTAMDPPVPCR